MLVWPYIVLTVKTIIIFTCNMEDRNETKSKSSYFDGFFLLATFVNLGKKFPVVLLKLCIVPSIQSRTLEQLHSFPHDILRVMRSWVDKKSYFLGPCIVCILNKLLCGKGGPGGKKKKKKSSPAVHTRHVVYTIRKICKRMHARGTFSICPPSG